MILISNMVLAQHHKPERKEDHEKLKSQKVAFITEKLNLTVPESQSFWPLYNELQQKREKLVEEKKEMMQKIKKELDTMTDSQLEEIMEKHFKQEQEELDLSKEYSEKFRAVLPLKKVVLLHQAEKQFKRELLHQIGEKKAEKKPLPE